MRPGVRKLATRVVASLAVAAVAFAAAPSSTDRPVTVLDAFAIPAVTIVNPGLGRSARIELVVRDGRIQSAESSAARTSPPSLERLRGSFVLPGLIDMHVHYWSEDSELFGLLLLASGVTTVRDTGDTEGAIFGTRARIDGGYVPGPRIFACGPILDGSPPSWAGSVAADDEADAARAVEEIADAGGDCIKVYRKISPRVLAAIHRASRKRALPVIGHVPESVPLEKSGLSDVQHLTGVAAPSGQLGGESVIALAAAWRNLADERLDRVVRVSKDRSIAHTPTLVFWERLFRLSRGGVSAGDNPIPAAHRLLFWDPSPEWRESEPRPPLDDAFARMRLAVRRLQEAGVTVHAGSDALNPFLIPGESLHEELRHLEAAGFTPERAFEAATRVAAVSLGAPELGRVRARSTADFLVFREDPTRDLDALSTMEAVVVRGRLYSAEDLRRELSRLRRSRENAVSETVSVSLARVQRLFGLADRRL